MNYKNIIENYFDGENIKILLYENKVYIDNYKSLNNFDKDKIIVVGKDKNIEIIGDNLLVSKLLDKELLVTGKILNVSFLENGK